MDQFRFKRQRLNNATDAISASIAPAFNSDSAVGASMKCHRTKTSSYAASSSSSSFRNNRRRLIQHHRPISTSRRLSATSATLRTDVAVVATGTTASTKKNSWGGYIKHKVSTASSSCSYSHSSSVLPSGRRSSAQLQQQQQQQQQHVICAIGENLARETCVASIDLSAPTILTVTKQCNGQSYAETLAYLSILRPDEVLMNEGRQHSPLANKVTCYYGLLQQQKQRQTAQCSSSSNNIIGPFSTTTVVKFVSRVFFDQTKGADLLRRLARKDTYDATLVEEYILLSTSYAVLHYTQKVLNVVAYSKHTLDVRAHFGGPHRMEIDRSTILQLELLCNAKTGKTQHSLIGSIDRTKTTVGGRLLRTTLMAPPSRLDTINARLDLVDTFLHDEHLFDAVLHELKALPAIDKMLTDVALIPNFHNRKKHHLYQNHDDHLDSLQHHIVGTTLAASAKATPTPTVDDPNPIALSSSIPSMFAKLETADRDTISVNARLANKGISALVCIKSTLEALPSLASILTDHLHRKATSNDDDDDDDRIDVMGPNGEHRTEATIATDRSSLLIGLGVGGVTLTNPKSREGPGVSSNSSPSQHHHHRDQLLRAIVYALKQPELRVVCDTITDVFSETTTYKRNCHTMKYQECFALKSSSTTSSSIGIEEGINVQKSTTTTNNDDEHDGGREIMDIIREAFLRNVDDIYRIADEYRERYGILATVKFSAARGYFLSLPGDVESTLPNEFIQPGKVGKNIHCTTEEIQSLNIRAQDNIQDLLLMTHERIQSVLSVARSKYDALARVSDAIALLDLCHSFADKVTLSKQSWARPLLTEPTRTSVATLSGVGIGVKEGGCEINDDSMIAIRNGRFGIDVMAGPANDEVGQSKMMIPNDTYATKSKYFTIISGINGSGKSTYLKQIGIIVLLAHCGGYVPAEYAKIPLRNRICARIATTDNQESNISTFLFEMKETAFICNNASPGSLILLDELGRATSNEDGVAIAWSVAETLLSKRALAFFVTHYPHMCEMSKIYPNVQNQHMMATISKDDGVGDSTILYSHRVGNGPHKVTSDYGVEMAKYCGWPTDMVAKARAIEKSLQDRLAQSGFCGDSERNTEAENHNKMHLKSLSSALQTCVLASSSINELRTSLQTLDDRFKSGRVATALTEESPLK